MRSERVTYADQCDLAVEGSRVELRVVKRDFWKFGPIESVIEIEAEIWVKP